MFGFSHVTEYLINFFIVERTDMDYFIGSDK